MLPESLFIDIICALMSQSDPTSTGESLVALLERVRGCDICKDTLPLGPRPVVRAQASARVLIIGQAPGTKVHETGTPWNDPSGDRLRDWLQLDKETFYDDSRVAIVPTGLCYPGRYEKGGDLPPRPECAPKWHASILSHLVNVRLTLLVGSYAQAIYLGDQRKRTLTQTVAAWKSYMPDYLPTPHPSWRTKHWAKKNPWFEAEVVPEIRKIVKALL
jgi:uracil-DNA glycosylase